MDRTTTSPRRKPTSEELEHFESLPASENYELPVPRTKRGLATREKLLNAAERVFGSDGYVQASITAITTEAGVAQGSFYTYFPSKHAIFVELVKDFSMRVRHTLAVSAAKREPTSSRAAVERQGLETIFGFILEHPELYRVVREAELFAPEMHRWYFTSFVAAYVHAYPQLPGDGAMSTQDIETLGWMMVAIADMLGLRWAIWEQRLPPTQVFDQVERFLSHGFGSVPSARPTTRATTRRASS